MDKLQAMTELVDELEAELAQEQVDDTVFDQISVLGCRLLALVKALPNG